jgi:hypothetical protein
MFGALAHLQWSPQISQLAALDRQARTQSLKGKKFPNPQVEEIPTTGGYTEYSTAPWWKHGDRYQVRAPSAPVRVIAMAACL